MPQSRAKIPCPSCGGKRSRTFSTDHLVEGVLRTYICSSCQRKFKGIETLVEADLYVKTIPAEPLRILMTRELDRDSRVGAKKRLAERAGMGDEALRLILSGFRKSVQRYNAEIWAENLGFSPFEIWPDYF